ncbi:MAG: HlyC/CorC family transporter [Pirellulales bacterium]|nr:HlyC/CorC family transporter [Pirellulales bacterium]
MSPELVWWLAAIGLATTCLAAMAARSLAEFSPHELEEICRRRKAPDRLGQILRRRDHVTLAAETLQVMATATFLGAGASWIWMWEAAAHLSGTRFAVITAGGTLSLLAAEIWIPWAFVRLWAEPFLFYTWNVWQLVGHLLSPFVLVARFVDGLLHRLAGRSNEAPNEESFEEDIRTIVTEGHREGLLEEDARVMIEGVIELGDLDVSEIMTPRTDMVTLPMSFTWQEALEFVVKDGHTRIPVSNKNRDDIVGVLYIKDLLPELAKSPHETVKPWTSLLREAYFVPETKPIDVLLQEFQATRNHMAVVLDEYGGVSGLVTLEDVLEEIVGEIIDEYDQEQAEGIRVIDDGLAEVLGKVHIDEINEQLELDLPDHGDYDTIGGFVFSELGHIPVVGEELARDKVRITVTDATSRRIERVRIEVLDDSRRDTA